MRRWAQWLQAKYGSQEALARAWGNALQADETLEPRTSFRGKPVVSWALACPGRRPRTRLLDNAAFCTTAGPVLLQVRQGHPGDGLPGPIVRLLLAGPGHAAPLLQPVFGL